MKLTPLFLAIVLFFISNTVVYADDTYDLVHLKDSTIIKGKIIETIPNKSITIKSFDGKIQTFDYDQILKIQRDESFYNNCRDSSYSELGICYGTPAVFNLAIGPWYGPFGVRFSGMYLGSSYGIQMNLNYKISDSPNFLHSIGVAVGKSFIEGEEIAYFPFDDNFTYMKEWQYIGLVYNLNLSGFFLEGGLSIGEGDYTNPKFIFQIGFIYRSIIVE